VRAFDPLLTCSRYSLVHSAGKGKITKNTNEAEYRAIFDNLISDLLAVLFWPEWPAASLLMDIICKYMVNSLDDVKSHNSSNDNNAAKASALDHLGTIAARLRMSLLKFVVVGKDDEEEQLRPLDDVSGQQVKSSACADSWAFGQVVAKLDLRMLERLIAVHHDVMGHLATRATEDQAYDVGPSAHAPRPKMLTFMAYAERTGAHCRQLGSRNRCIPSSLQLDPA